MIILGLDTCLNACSVAVLDGPRVLAWRSETMARGHQERLALMAEAVMAEAGLGFGALERIAATHGPGSFTGLRVGIAFAKGLGSALEVPVVGVGVLEALAQQSAGVVAAAVDARRDQVYLQIFAAGAALTAPQVLAVDVAARQVSEAAAGRKITLIGSGAPLIAHAAPGARTLEPAGCDPRDVARLAASRPAEPIQPLYLRAPDARLPT